MLRYYKRHKRHLKRLKMANKRKYIVNYYGWIASYGDWDCDDFIVRAPNKTEAIQLANERLKNTLLKGKPHVELYSTAKRKMEEYDKNCKTFNDAKNLLLTKKTK